MRDVPAPGSLVWLRQRRWRVERARTDERTLRLDVAGHATRLTVLAPYDQPRVLARPGRVVRVRRQQARARLARVLAASPPAGLASAAVTAHVRLWPYQLEPLLAVLDGQRRLLVADEVGLGKTIQAGLILAEVLKRTPEACALVIVPAGLREQWTGELRRRFSLGARDADSGIGAADLTTGAGPGDWRQPGIWLASIDFLKQRHVRDGIPVRAWDVVVVDEAHLATGSSDRHDICDELGRRARHLILLSATPHDGDGSRFARLMRLGSLPFAGDTLAVFRRTRADAGMSRTRVVRWKHVRATSSLTTVLNALGDFERTVLAASRPAQRDAALLLLTVFRKRALSTLAALDRSLSRRLEWLESAPGQPPDWLQPGLDFGADDPDGDDHNSLAVPVSLPRARERARLRRLRLLVAACGGHEPKLAYVCRCAARSHEPFVLFTEFRDSLDLARKALGRLRVVATIHGGQADAERRENLAAFLSGPATVLIATDVGSQGLNLQHRARWLFNLELPWNPTRLEQRLGRLDRIDQAHPVHATLLVTGHAAENTLLASLCRRTLAARSQFNSGTLVDATPPARLAIAASLIAGATLETQPVEHVRVELETRYRRTARAHATVTARRRRLARLWHEADGSCGSRPVWTKTVVAGLGIDARAVAIVSTLIIDRSGDLVERRLIAVAAVGGSCGTADVTAAIEEALPSLRPYVARRMRRLQRQRSASIDRRLATERAIALHLHLLTNPRQAQLGLFSRREATVFQDALARAAFTAAAASRRIRLEEDRRHLSATATVIEWIAEAP